MPVVAMDASALMMPVELDLRVFDELDRLLGDPELVTPRAVVSELDRLAGNGSREARAARVGLDLAGERCRVVEPDGYDVGDASATDGDDALVALAEAGAVDYVVTNDRLLRDRLLEAGVPVVGVRGRNTLAITGP
ncbi:MAG TPA: twitching motility protein PilT [Halobacteriales archaeon]|nr:twitching motility protein PilT [Halobacteriales archaeon]